MAAKGSAFTLAGAVALSLVATGAFAKRKHKSAPVNDGNSTPLLYQLLNDSYGGRLKGFCILAGFGRDPERPNQEFQRVVSVDYDRRSFFGRLQIHVRLVAKLTPAQLKSYTPAQIFNFAVSDAQTFEKIHSGPFGQQGDLYLRATDSAPPASAPITNQVREEYENLISRYILPALQKQQ